MPPSAPVAPAGACPVSAVILAARQAKTPLAIAHTQPPGATLLFANDAFAAMLDCEPDSLVGRPLNALGIGASGAVMPGTSTRLELATSSGRPFPAALSIAAVPGADGAAVCLLCSLVDARGEGADEAIARDARLLSEVAQAAGALMRESAAAARMTSPGDVDASASSIAFDAVAHATRATMEDRA